MTPAESESRIARLTITYALATDAIGSGDFVRGRELYRSCFTTDARIAVYFPNVANDFTGTPDSVKTGPDEWADFVLSVFQQNQYSATQHLIGCITIHADGSQGKMTSYPARHPQAVEHQYRRGERNL